MNDGYLGPRIINIRDYPYFAKGDGITDDAAAFDKAIIDLPAGGGEIHVPEGSYKFGHTVRLPNDRLVIIRGRSGSNPYFPTSQILADTGVTAFQSRFTGQQFISLSVAASGKLATNSNVAHYQNNSNTITVSGGHDFIAGQVVCLPGVGPLKSLTTLTSSVLSSSDSVTISFPSSLISSPFGIIAGKTYLVIPGAFNFPTKVLTVVGSTVTMATTSTGAVSGIVPQIATDMYFRIQNVATNTLTVDNTNLSGISDGYNIPLEHGDCAIDATYKTDVIGCSFGAFSQMGFNGAALLFLGSHNYTPQSNVSLSTVRDGYAYDCRSAIFTYGEDANAIGVYNFHAITCHNYSFVELSSLGNSYTGCYSDGYGFIVNDSSNNHSGFTDCSLKSSTVVSWFGTGSQIRGGQTSDEAGGWKFGTAGYTNKLDVGSAVNGFHTHQVRFDPTSKFFELIDDGYSHGLLFKMGAAGDGYVSGLGWLKAKWSSTLRTALGIAFEDNGSADLAGTLWFPNGFKIGTGNDGTDNPTVSVNVNAAVGVPSASSPNGSIYIRKDGTAGTTLYIRESGVWNSIDTTGGGTITMGGDVSGNSASSTVVKIQNNAVQSGALGVSQDGYVLTWVNADGYWEAKNATDIDTLAGDVTGPIGSNTVVKIQNKTLASSLSSIGASQDGYILTWVNGSTDWEAKPASVGFTAGGDLTGTSTSQQVVSLTGSGGVVNSVAAIKLDSGTANAFPADGYIRSANYSSGAVNLWEGRNAGGAATIIQQNAANLIFGDLNGTSGWNTSLKGFATAVAAYSGLQLNSQLAATTLYSHAQTNSWQFLEYSTSNLCLGIDSVLASGTMKVSFGPAVVPTIKQDAAVSDIVPAEFKITSQAPFAGASTAAKKTTGSIVFDFPAVVAGGNDPLMIMRYDGTDYYTVGPHPAAPGTQIGVPTGYLMQFSSGGQSSFILATDYTKLASPLGGYLNLSWNTGTIFGYFNSTGYGISEASADSAPLYKFDFSTTAILHFGARALSATIKQDISTTGNGVDFTIAAQDGYVTNPANGGNLILNGGLQNSTGTVGAVRVGTDRNDWVSASGQSVYGKKLSVQTTSNAATNIETFALPDAKITSVYVTVSAYQTAGTGSPDCGEWQLKGVWRSAGGAGVEVKAPTVVDSNPNTTGTAWTAVLLLSNNNVLINVTGDSSKTINWKCTRIAYEAG